MSNTANTTMTWTDLVEAAATDAIREQAVHEHGLVSRPDRSLRDNAKFAAIQRERWKLQLASDMAYFVRSVDTFSDWNYDGLKARLEDANLALPSGMTIADAVAIVDRDIRDCSLTWYDKNIARPMGVRASSVQVGTASLSGEPDTGHTESAWMRGVSTDHDAHDLATICADLTTAAARLEKLADDHARQAATYRTRADNTRADGFSYVAAVYQGAALAARALLAESIPDDSASLSDSITSLRDRNERVKHTVTGPENNPFIQSIARATNAQLARGDRASEFARDIARELLEETLATLEHDRTWCPALFAPPESR